MTTCFNTASVLIQLANLAIGLAIVTVSIQLLFLFNCVGSCGQMAPMRVSIQLLFLFNNPFVKENVLPNMFQYSFCSYSTTETDEQTVFDTLFQYSFCSYSTSSACGIAIEDSLFQYSFCSYSTDYSCIVWTHAPVSIQLLFLFNLNDSKVNISPVCFNTASVLIQQKATDIVGINLWFQYSFCSYSTDYSCIVWTHAPVSIQLLFLFNRGFV